MSANLKTGDVLVFKADNGWIGKTIAWLTDSDVSHAAMVYDGKKIVEMGSKGIQTREFSIEENERETYVRRLNPEKDSAPLVKAADKYIQAETDYDYPALLLLAGLAVYSHIRPTSAVQKAIDALLPFVCVQLDLLIRKLTKHKSKTMVCSQLVYQCYYDCGEEYAIKLKRGFLKETNKVTLDMADGAEPETIRLIDMVTENETMFAAGIDGDTDETVENILAGVNENTEETEEMLARQLYEAFTSPVEEDMAFAVNSFKNSGTIAKTGLFVKLIEKLSKALDMSTDGLFVTPADFLNNTENLKEVIVQ